ncbi:hypothetical protein HD553DRAFT_343961 [Filobasidium floriforme]|uniref:uncharacterized protein n=1 Tax=Filobasidium floriforme TaxID=5210 RepID=UPI001E8DF11C|nr:uncharacterized protein HD553DRAFT_343961 [Filobasidium floriforme]KAH8081888.1 hypothetical protein HD553DRAFT_343961 [Filobasidium floriforme]
MAGGGHGGFEPVKIDPAIERWNHMRENVYRTFKFTPKTARQVTLWGALVPALVGLGAWAANGQLDWAGKQRGQSLYASAPGPQQKEVQEE